MPLPPDGFPEPAALLLAERVAALARAADELPPPRQRVDDWDGEAAADYGAAAAALTRSLAVIRDGLSSAARLVGAGG